MGRDRIGPGHGFHGSHVEGPANSGGRCYSQLLRGLQDHTNAPWWLLVQWEHWAQTREDGMIWYDDDDGGGGDDGDDGWQMIDDPPASNFFVQEIF